MIIKSPKSHRFGMLHRKISTTIKTGKVAMMQISGE